MIIKIFWGTTDIDDLGVLEEEMVEYYQSNPGFELIKQEKIVFEKESKFILIAYHKDRKDKINTVLSA